jgi:tRNA threonylcarbamoyladenosine biosynthesis protein TsaB
VTARLLAFDTSTEQLAMAVAGPTGEHLLLLPGGAQASAALLPAVHRLLAEAGLRLQELDAIAFGQGPGAFTGLRTSCAVAQGLGFGLDRPLLPLDSLLLVAEDARAQHPGSDDVAVVMDARMDEVYGGRYRWADGRWQVLVPPALYTLPAAAALWHGGAPALVAGSAVAAFGDRLGLPAGQPVCMHEQARAVALLRLARQAHAAGAGIPAEQALPLYLRDKVAQTTAEREAARAAKAADR